MTGAQYRPPTGAVNEQLIEHADLTYQIITRQISRDYTAFIKRHVFKDLTEYKDLSFRELTIVVIVNARGDKGMHAAEIASILRVDAATITRGVSKLVDKGYLMSRDDLHDSRAKFLYASDRGQAFGEAYRRQCLRAIAYADEKIGTNDTDRFIPEGYETLYALQDRAHAFRAFKLRAKQSFVVGQGKMKPALAQPDNVMNDYADFAFQICADQIASDYMQFIQTHIIPDMNMYRKMATRERRVLMVTDFQGRSLSAADIARLTRFEPATVSRALTVLIDQGLMTALDDDYDGRSKLLSVTDLGHEYAELYRAVAKKKVEAAEAHLGVSWDYEKRKDILNGLRTLLERSSKLAALKRPRALENRA